MASPGFGVKGARRSRREHQRTKGAEWGRGGEGCPLPSRLEVWGSVASSPSGVPGGSSPGRWSHFLHVLSHRTLLVARKIRFSCPNSKVQLKNCKLHFGKVTVITTFKSGGDKSLPPHTKLRLYAMNKLKRICMYSMCVGTHQHNVTIYAQLWTILCWLPGRQFAHQSWSVIRDNN